MPYTPPAVKPLTEQDLPVPLNPGAPLNPSQPSANPIVNAAIGMSPVVAATMATNAVAGWEVPAIAGVVNIAIEWFKNRRWFREEPWTIPLLFILSFVICIVVWYFFFNDMQKGVLNAFGVISNAHVNYHGSQIAGMGILKPTATENKWVS